MRLWRENNPLKIAWDLLVCLMAFITGLILPMELLKSFGYGHALTPLWSLFSLIGLLDIALTFNTSFERNGIIVKDRRLIVRRYLRGWFWLDLFANLPFLVMSGMHHNLPLVTMLPLLRLPQLWRITARWEDIQLLNTAVLRMLRYSSSIMLITNWIACLWLWVGLRDFSPQGWIQRLELARDDFFDLYLHSLYWTVTTLATVGYGDITPKTRIEIILAIGMMIVGALLYAFVVGNVVSILNQLDGGRSDYRKRQSAIADFLGHNGVDQDTITRVRRFNDYQWARTRGFQARELFEELPGELRSEVTYKMLRDQVETVPLFSKAPPGLRNRLLMLLQPVTFPPDIMVLPPEAMGDEIVFITKGELEIDTPVPLPTEVLRISAGDYVGDLSFFLKEERTCGVRSKTYVDAFVLSRSVFDHLRAHEPRLKEVLLEMARQQSQRNQSLLLAGLVV